MTTKQKDTCVACKGKFKLSDLHLIEGELWCEDCASEDFEHCSTCGKWVQRGEYNKYHETCNSCLNSDEDD